jgi:hypothetical protein
MGRFSGSATGPCGPPAARPVRVDQGPPGPDSGHPTRVPDMGRFSGSASRPRVGSVLPRLAGAGRPALAQRVAAGLERGQHERPLLRRQTGPQQQRPVVVVAAHIAQLGPGPAGAGLVAQHAPVGAHDPLQLRRRRVAGDHDQVRLGLRRRDPRQRPDLRIARLAAREARPQLRQPMQQPRHPHLLARRRRTQAAAVAQPIRARPAAPPGPALAAVELPNQQQPAARRRSAKVHLAPRALPDELSGHQHRLRPPAAPATLPARPNIERTSVVTTKPGSTDPDGVSSPECRRHAPPARSRGLHPRSARRWPLARPPARKRSPVRWIQAKPAWPPRRARCSSPPRR